MSLLWKGFRIGKWDSSLWEFVYSDIWDILKALPKSYPAPFLSVVDACMAGIKVPTELSLAPNLWKMMALNAICFNGLNTSTTRMNEINTNENCTHCCKFLSHVDSYMTKRTMETMPPPK